jgi:hypothetical protein
MTCFWVPLDASILELQEQAIPVADWTWVFAYFAVTLLSIAAMFGLIAAFLRNRWGMTGR